MNAHYELVMQMLSDLKDAMQQDYKNELFGTPPVPNSDGLLQGGSPPDMKKLSVLYK